MNRKEFAIVSVIFFATVIAWILFSIYHVKDTSTVSNIQLQEVVPLTPTFDSAVIKSLQKRTP